jgi:hypothetical protein
MGREKVALSRCLSQFLRSNTRQGDSPAERHAAQSAEQKCDRLEQHETKNLSGSLPFDAEG